MWPWGTTQNVAAFECWSHQKSIFFFAFATVKDGSSKLILKRLKSKPSGILDVSKSAKWLQLDRIHHDHVALHAVQTEVDWILTQQANLMLAIIIIFQAFLLGAEVSLELQSQHAGQKHMPLRWSIAFEFLDVVLLFIFSVEYLLRCHALQLTYVFSWLGGIDLMLLLTGIFSTVVISMELAFGNVSGTLLSTVHSVRRLRILRIARLLQIFPALQVLIKGLIGTMIAITDSMILICLMSFVGALLCCEALGDENQSIELRNFFGSVAGSFLIHIQLVLVEAWPDIASVMMTNSPFWGIYVIVFIAFSNFTILNVVTGVVCDAVLELAQTKPPMSMEQQHLKFETLKAEIEDWQKQLETKFESIPKGPKAWKKEIGWWFSRHFFGMFTPNYLGFQDPIWRLHIFPNGWQKTTNCRKPLEAINPLKEGKSLTKSSPIFLWLPAVN